MPHRTYAQRLRFRLGPELTSIVALRAQGRILAEIGTGRAGVSTVHEQQGKAVQRVRDHVRQYGLGGEDLEPVLAAVVA